MRRYLAMIGCVLAAACVDTTEEIRPHILLITSDTLRADHLSVNGYPRATSPALDALASGSWHFTDAVTVIPKTGPAFATMFTGHHPQVHGVRSNFEAIPPGLSVLAEQLRDLGYQTAAFVGNPVLRSGKGFDRGFEHYRVFDGKRAEGVRSLTSAFMEWAEERAWDRPSFAWVHYMDPHGPYTPPEPVLRPFLEDELARSDERVPLEPGELPSGNANKVLGAIPAYQRLEREDRVAVYVARYDAEIRYMDSVFGELVAFLERRGLYEDSAIVFTSDHGESLGEHDYYFEHGWFAFEPTLHIPLMIKEPRQREGRIEDRQVSILDLQPTILALAGARPDGDGSSVDLLGPWDERGPLLIESSDRYPDKYHGVRTSNWKYVIRAGDGAEELYDLREDPGELHNVAEREPDRLDELRRVCAEQLARAREAALPQATGVPDDPETLERLKALGYLGH